MAIMLTISIPTAFLWLYAEELLLLVGQNPKVSKMAGDFCKWSIPGLWGLFLCMWRFRQPPNPCCTFQLAARWRIIGSCKKVRVFQIKPRCRLHFLLKYRILGHYAPHVGLLHPCRLATIILLFLSARGCLWVV